MLFPQVKTSTSVLAYFAALVSALAVSVILFRLLEPLRKGGLIARFFARFWIIGAFYFTLAVVMVLVAGPYIFSGPMRSGRYISDPITFRETVLGGIALGLLGAVLWPLVTKAKGYDADM
jgi:hypothetical protein